MGESDMEIVSVASDEGIEAEFTEVFRGLQLGNES